MKMIIRNFIYDKPLILISLISWTRYIFLDHNINIYIYDNSLIKKIIKCLNTILKIKNLNYVNNMKFGVQNSKIILIEHK